MNKVKIGLIQMKVLNDKKENLLKASQLIKNISIENPHIIVLPEMFTTPYIASNFPLYAEKEKDYTYNFLSNLAKVGANLAKTVLPPLAKVVDLVANNLDKLLPLAVSVYTAYKS